MTRVLFALLGLGIIIGTGLLALGIANPPRAEELVWDGVIADTPPPLPEHFSLEAETTLANTHRDEIGIWFDNGDGTRTVIAINGAQYVTARRCPSEFAGCLDDCEPFIEPNQGVLTYWRYFRHIHTGDPINTLRFNDLGNGKLTLWINGEWMWDIPVNAGQIWGTWGRSWDYYRVFRSQSAD